MLAQESTIEEIPCSKDMRDTTDELGETLSLCDLPLYSDQSADWDQDLSIASNSMSSSQEDCFEFFSQELNPSAAATDSPPGDIIFCGKFIPFKHHEKLDSSNIVEIKDQTDKKKRGWPMSIWKFSSSRSSKRQLLSKNGTRCKTSLMQQSPKKMCNTNKLRKGHDRMSIFTASSSSGKAKWYMFLIGISRFSPVVDLTDIKNRQSRRHCTSPSSPPASPPPSSIFGIQDRKDMLSGRGWGSWGLIRALSCGGDHQSTTKATAS